MRHDQQGRLGLQLARQNDLLLVAAGQTADSLLRGRAAHIVLFHHLLRVLVDSGLVQQQAVPLAELRLIRCLQHQILRNGHVADQSLRVSVLRDVGHVIGDKGIGVKDRHLLVLQIDTAALRRDHAGDQLRQLRLAVAVHTGDAHDLAPVDLQGHIVDAAVLVLLVIVHMGQLRHHLCAGGVLLLVLGLAQLLADHHVGQLLPVGVGTVHRAHHLTQPQHSDAVGDVQHLAHLVADEDDALALADQLAHDGEQALHLNVGQRGGRLVQNQQLRPVIQRLEDLGALLLAHGDLRNELVQLHVQAVLGGQLLDLLPARRPVDEQPLGVLIAQNDVVEYGHGLHQHKVLMHHADTQLHRLAG